MSGERDAVRVLSFRFDPSDLDATCRAIREAFDSVDWDRLDRDVRAMGGRKAPKDGTGTHKRRQTGAVVSVYFDDFLGSWITACDTHGQWCEHGTKSAAVAFGSSPADWCTPCWAIFDARQSGGAS